MKKILSILVFLLTLSSASAYFSSGGVVYIKPLSATEKENVLQHVTIPDGVQRIDFQCGERLTINREARKMRIIQKCREGNIVQNFSVNLNVMKRGYADIYTLSNLNESAEGYDIYKFMRIELEPSNGFMDISLKLPLEIENPVLLHQIEGRWTTEEISKVSEDEGLAYYSGRISEYSLFAIATKTQGEGISPPVVEEPQPTPTEAPDQEQPAAEPQPTVHPAVPEHKKEGTLKYWVLAGIAVFIFAVMLVALLNGLRGQHEER